MARMEAKTIAVCTAVGLLGLLSAALGFAAEATRVKVTDVQIAPGECVYPRTPAMGLGISSAVALIIAHFIINALAGCICCKRQPHPSGTNWRAALICFAMSWVAFIISFLLLLTGAALNDQKGQESMYFGSLCYVVRPGVFSGGAVLSLASIALGIVYYVALSSYKENSHPGASQANQGVAMGRAQIPPHSTQPVFVNEDTYNRQQFP